MAERDRKTNQWASRQVFDVMERIVSTKWGWAGHITRGTDERWTMDWRSLNPRTRGSPERWKNGITKLSAEKNLENKLAMRVNGSFEMKGNWGGLYPQQ